MGGLAIRDCKAARPCRWLRRRTKSSNSGLFSCLRFQEGKLCGLRAGWKICQRVVAFLAPPLMIEVISSRKPWTSGLELVCGTLAKDVSYNPEELTSYALSSRNLGNVRLRPKSTFVLPGAANLKTPQRLRGRVSCEVTGTDISPIQPTWVPPNLKL